jgi:hypothetical protein
LHELYCRSKPLKVNAVYVSLCFALIGGVFIVLWGVLGVATIVGPGSGADMSAARDFFLLATIPGGLVFPFAGAMVISLAWRKVVIASDLKSSDNKQAIDKREKGYRNMVVVFCIAMFLIILFMMATVGIEKALILLVLFNFAGGFFFYRTGKAFQRNMSTTFGINTSDSGAKEKMTPEEACLRAASRANRLVIIGMFLVVLGSVLTTLALNVLGVPSIVGDVEIAAFPSLLIAIGVGTSEIAMVLYSSQLRMIGVNRRKSKSKTKTGMESKRNVISTVASSAAPSEIPVAKGIHGPVANKVTPSN